MTQLKNRIKTLLNEQLPGEGVYTFCSGGNSPKCRDPEAINYAEFISYSYQCDCDQNILDMSTVAAIMNGWGNDNICEIPGVVTLYDDYGDSYEWTNANCSCCEYCPEGQEWNGEQCVDPPIYGCTRQNAINYNPEATVNDGSCEFPDFLEPLDPYRGEPDYSTNNPSYVSQVQSQNPGRIPGNVGDVSLKPLHPETGHVLDQRKKKIKESKLRKLIKTALNKRKNKN